MSAWFVPILAALGIKAAQNPKVQKAAKTAAKKTGKVVVDANKNFWGESIKIWKKELKKKPPKRKYKIKSKRDRKKKKK